MIEQATTPPESPAVGENLGVLFRHAARLMLRGHHHHGPMHPAQGRLLSILTAKGEIERKELMELLGVRSGSLSELLGKLERHGCISRTRDENDKRGFMISVTDKGAAMISEHDAWIAEKENQLFSSLTDEEKAQLGAILTKLATAWKNARAEEGDEEAHHHGHGHGHGRMLHHRGRHGHIRGEGRRHGPGTGETHDPEDLGRGRGLSGRR